jgi:hypothetical protein
MITIVKLINISITSDSYLFVQRINKMFSLSQFQVCKKYFTITYGHHVEH